MRITEINKKLSARPDVLDEDEKEYMTRLGYVTTGLAIVGAFTVVKKLAQLIS
jgi:hypothetical protein